MRGEEERDERRGWGSEKKGGGEKRGKKNEKVVFDLSFLRIHAGKD